MDLHEALRAAVDHFERRALSEDDRRRCKGQLTEDRRADATWDHLDEYCAREDAADFRAIAAALRGAIEGREWPAPRPMETAPRDGTEILCTDGENFRVCYPKTLPRPVSQDDDMSESRPGDIWEYHRDNENAPGHTWSMIPTGWWPLPPQESAP